MTLNECIDLLRDVLYGKTVNFGYMYSWAHEQQHNMQEEAAFVLGLIATEECIKILKHFIESDDFDVEVKPHAIRAFGVAVKEYFHEDIEPHWRPFAEEEGDDA